MFTITQEQQKCIDHVLIGEDSKIKAFAGSGKL